MSARRKFFWLFLFVALALSASLALLWRPRPSSAVKIYLYDPLLDQGPGGAQCSRQGLVGVDRFLSGADTPLTGSIKLLLRGNISGAERARGLSTEFPLPGVELERAYMDKTGAVTLILADPQARTSGGACRAGILWFQLEATAKQFPGVTSVRFMPEDLFQP